MARHRQNRKKILFSARGLILCEGETEENYFSGLVTQDKYKRKFQAIDVNIHKPKNHSPVGLVNKAKEMIKQAKRDKNPYDFVWVVFDKDGHAKVPQAFEIARVTNPKIQIAFTIPCFEFFALLHFERTTKPFVKCYEAIHQIDKKWLPGYEKASNLFEVLFPHMENGLANSRWVVERMNSDIQGGTKIYDLSAYSNIHDIVDYLYNLI